MLFGVLGVVEARPFPASPPIDLGSPLQRVLLCLLLTEADRSVSFDRIVEELWGDAPPADPSPEPTPRRPRRPAKSQSDRPEGAARPAGSPACPVGRWVTVGLQAVTADRRLMTALAQPGTPWQGPHRPGCAPAWPRSGGRL